jgi:hypothetical protein
MDAPDPRTSLEAAIRQLQADEAKKRAEYDRVAGELRQIQQRLSRLTLAIQTVNEFIPSSPLPAPPPYPQGTFRLPSLFTSLNGADDEVVDSPSPPLYDLTGKTALESALLILEERSPEPVHFRDLAAAAILRGYRSPKGTDDTERLEKTFWDTLRRVKHLDSPEPVVFEGDGKFRYEPHKAELLARREKRQEPFT